MEIRRCRHIKVNGTQCGSPALRGKCYCYFHSKNHNLGAYGVRQRGLQDRCRFPVLEDADSVLAALMHVMRLILAKEIDLKEAGLLLYAVQIASCNLQHIQLQPPRDEMVVDPMLVGYSALDENPARLDELEPETEAEQKALDRHEEQLKKSQQQARAEWEREVPREFGESSQEPEDSSQESKDVAPNVSTEPPRAAHSSPVLA